MAKPLLSTTRWTDVTAGNRTEPVSGKKDTGWAVGERVPSQHLNFLFYALYIWISYLDALLGGSGVSETLKAAGIDVSANATVGGTLGVTGLATFTVAPTAPTYKHSSQIERIVHAFGGMAVTPANWGPTGGTVEVVSPGSDPGLFFIPIPVESGERIVDFALEVLHLTGSETMSGTLKRIGGNTGSATTIGTVNSANSTSRQSIDSSALNHDVVSNSKYYVEVDATHGTGTPAGDQAIYGVRIRVTRP